jgi:hypothetical protein
MAKYNLRFTTLLILNLLTSLVGAQIIVTNNTFPKDGDVLKVVTKRSLSSPLNLGNVGGPQTWDFSQLNSGTLTVTKCLNAKEGMDFDSFPSAELLLLGPNGSEQYIDVTPTKMSLIGLGRNNDVFPLPIHIGYSEAPVLREAPLSFIQSTTSIGKFNIELSSSFIPDSILTPGTIDSIRFQFISEERGLMDAFGKVKMQNKETEVLRQTVQRITEAKAFVKVPFLGWQDATSLIQSLGGLGSQALDFLGKDTSYVVNFISNTYKEILVSVDLDSAKNFESVSFADIGGIMSSTTNIKSKLGIQAYPNPASDETKIDCRALPVGNYLCVLYNSMGKTVCAQWLDTRLGETHTFSTKELTPGIYTIAVIGKNKGIVGTTKLLKQ